MRTPCPPWFLLAVFITGCVAPGAAQSTRQAPSATALLEAPLPSFAAGTSSSNPDPAAPMGIVLSAPPATRPPRLRCIDWTMIGAAATLRVLDYTSTEAALADPAHFREAELPTALVDNKPAFAAFETATVVVNYAAYRVLVRRHMRSLARASQFVYTGIMTITVANNDRLLHSVPGD